VNDPRFSLPGMIMGAHFSWSAEPVSLDILCEDISRLAYLDGSGKVVGLLAQLQDCDVYSWWHLVQYREYALNRADEGHGNTLQVIDEAKAMAANQCIADIAQALTALAGKLDTSCRKMLHCWLVACEGLQVWNLAGLAVSQHRRDAALAERLERWLRQYEQHWRQVSKESELWRIREMVRWYAERLRV
jgi:hypothetical protein